MYKVLEKKSGELKLEIEVKGNKLKKATEIVTEEVGKNINVPGFRPGKAPQFMIEKEVGKDTFWAKVVDKVVPESFYEAVIAEKVTVISQPQIQVKEFVPGEKLLFEAIVAILPEIKDLKYKNLGIKFENKKPTEKEEKAALLGLRERYAKEIEVKRVAKKGDRVEIDFDGTMKGLPFDGGSSKNHPIVLGSGAMIPGFEEKIEGHKAGEEFDFDISFPKEYHANNLAGQKVNFKIKLNKVFEKELPKEDDSWAKSIGLKDLSELKVELSKQLAIEKEMAERRQTEDKIVKTIVEKNKIDAPEILVSEEIHRMVHEAEHNLSHSGLTIEKFLEMSKKTIEELHEEMKPEAENRVRIGITLGEIGKLEKIEIKDEEIDTEIEKAVSMAQPGTNVEDVKAFYDTPEKRNEIANGILIRKTVDKLWEYNIKK